MRTILHSDLNAFYASVETLFDPSLKNVPIAVCGDPQARHGIVLTKNQLAKDCGVKTGEPIWQARQKCPKLVPVASNMDQYVRFARWMREIYADYSDRVEPFGMDEAWIDVTGDNGKLVADEIRRRAKTELGLTASIGVANNKIFAKLGSDMKKPDATTVITQENYREKVWPLPVQDLLYVGPSTLSKLTHRGIRTIGDLAAYDRDLLCLSLGKAGETLHSFANGEDSTPVSRAGDEPPAKSIGNSTTTARDVSCEDDAKWVFMLLGELVGGRLREAGFRAGEIQVWVRDTELLSFERQARFPRPTDLDSEIIGAAMALFIGSYGWMKPIRSLGIRLGKLSRANEPEQITLFDDPMREKRRAMDRTIDSLRKRFGDDCVKRGFLCIEMRNDEGKMLAHRPHKEYRPFECVRQG
ncbi:DNA polymerase IV [Eubacteriales bacterium OttesenSCG-928-A19]|nr:DNA polymerase IV [Eubacteriales bacterium OttesenSCG-928-A19]